LDNSSSECGGDARIIARVRLHGCRSGDPPGQDIYDETEFISGPNFGGIGSGLAPEVEQMLVDDFATMTDRTRAYLIRQYRNGVE